jgi:RHS repeat-associated protein
VVSFNAFALRPPGTPVTKYYLFDGLGSTDRLTDASANVTDNYIYQAFGTIVASSGTTVNAFRYVGRLGYYYDSDLVRYYVRARHYDATLGRFLSADPFLQSALQSSSTGFYRYCNNQPINSVDPGGLLPSKLSIIPSHPKEPVDVLTCGIFWFPVHFQITPASKQGGYIVQEVSTSYSAKDCAGHDIVVCGQRRYSNRYPWKLIDPGTVRRTHYLEAWRVEPNHTSPGYTSTAIVRRIVGDLLSEFLDTGGYINDVYLWLRHEGMVRGKRSLMGTAYWIEGLDRLPSGIKKGNVPDAGDLPSAFLDEGQDLFTYFQSRWNQVGKGPFRRECVTDSKPHTIQVTWDCCQEAIETQGTKVICNLLARSSSGARWTALGVA